MLGLSQLPLRGWVSCLTMRDARPHKDTAGALAELMRLRKCWAGFNGEKRAFGPGLMRKGRLLGLAQGRARRP